MGTETKMEVKIKLSEENIAEVVNYIKNNPDDIKELMEMFAIEAAEILMKRNFIKNVAKAYKDVNSEINCNYRKEERP